MKEMTIEQKAKAYDEALVKIQKYVKDEQGCTRLKPEEIFPELKEIEGGVKDEMIRKAVISTFKPHCSFYEVSVDEVLAWFEKQFSKSRQKDIDDAYLKGVCDAKRELEKQGEQGPNTMTKLFTFDDILALQCAMTYAKINDYDLYVALQGLHDRILDVYYDEKQGEHKSVEKKELGKIESESAWSEEDELNLSEALHHIRMYNLANKADKLDKWLKDLKDRVLPHPKQEWSDEDENLLKLSLENLTELKERFGEEYGRVGDCINWLKSLSPKWKPNQAEIDFLNMIAGCMNKTLNEPEKAELKRIIEEIKKL